jgi:hypothetical protein
MRLSDGDAGWWEAPTVEERLLASELIARDRALLGDEACWTDEQLSRSEAWNGADESLVPWQPPTDEQVIDDVLERGVDAWSAAMLAAIDPSTLLDPLDRVRFVRAVDAVAAHVSSIQQRGLVAVAGARSSGAYADEVHIEHEVAMARRTSLGAAGRAIEVARSLATELRSTGAALGRGEISLAHAEALVAGTRHVADPERRLEVERRVLGRAATSTSAQFRRHVAASVCAVDALDEARRHARARADRAVWITRHDNGLGQLTVIDEWSRISALHDRITCEGPRAPAPPGWCHGPSGPCPRGRRTARPAR